MHWWELRSILTVCLALGHGAFLSGRAMPWCRRSCLFLALQMGNWGTHRLTVNVQRPRPLSQLFRAHLCLEKCDLNSWFEGICDTRRRKRTGKGAEEGETAGSEQEETEHWEVGLEGGRQLRVPQAWNKSTPGSVSPLIQPLPSPSAASFLLSGWEWDWGRLGWAAANGFF